MHSNQVCAPISETEQIGKSSQMPPANEKTKMQIVSEMEGNKPLMYQWYFLLNHYERAQRSVAKKQKKKGGEGGRGQKSMIILTSY